LPAGIGEVNGSVIPIVVGTASYAATLAAASLVGSGAGADDEVGALDEVGAELVDVFELLLPQAARSNAPVTSRPSPATERLADRPDTISS
jgi:hypothetical protein